MLPIVDGLNYLAAPYTHEDPHVREERYRQVFAATVKLLKGGHIIFSPLVHTHETGKALGRSVDHEFWIAQDVPILKASKRVIVLTLEGWRYSKGVAEEVSIAVKSGIPITHASPEDL